MESTNIILLKGENAVLLQLRDNIPTISYPNTWALPGGYIEENETPLQCIHREIREELGVELSKTFLFVATQRFYGFEHTFWSKVDFNIEDIHLTEGQAIRWFSFEEIQNIQLGYEDNAILEDFFSVKPWHHRATE